MTTTTKTATSMTTTTTTATSMTTTTTTTTTMTTATRSRHQSCRYRSYYFCSSKISSCQSFFYFLKYFYCNAENQSFHKFNTLVKKRVFLTKTKARVYRSQIFIERLLQNSNTIMISQLLGCDNSNPFEDTWKFKNSL